MIHMESTGDFGPWNELVNDSGICCDLSYRRNLNVDTWLVLDISILYAMDLHQSSLNIL